jgi:hypothetical protein
MSFIHVNKKKIGIESTLNWRLQQPCVSHHCAKDKKFVWAGYKWLVHALLSNAVPAAEIVCYLLRLEDNMLMNNVTLYIGCNLENCFVLVLLK